MCLSSSLSVSLTKCHVFPIGNTIVCNVMFKNGGEKERGRDAHVKNGGEKERARERKGREGEGGILRNQWA